MSQLCKRGCGCAAIKNGRCLNPMCAAAYEAGQLDRAAELAAARASLATACENLRLENLRAEDYRRKHEAARATIEGLREDLHEALGYVSDYFRRKHFAKYLDGNGELLSALAASCEPEPAREGRDGCMLNRAAYEALVAEDLAYLLKQPRTLERDHIEIVLRWSSAHLFESREPEPAAQGKTSERCDWCKPSYSCFDGSPRCSKMPGTYSDVAESQIWCSACDCSHPAGHCPKPGASSDAEEVAREWMTQLCGSSTPDCPNHRVASASILDEPDDDGCDCLSSLAALLTRDREPKPKIPL